MKAFNLHFIIVTYNGQKWIEKCLQSIQSLDGEFTVHIIDNGSTDDTVRICKELGFPVVANKVNLGFGAANNLGIQNAIQQGASHVFLLNQDAYMDVNSIRNFNQTEGTNNTDTLYAFLQMNGDGTDFDPSWKNSYLLEKNCTSFLDDYDQGKLKNIYPIKFANAAAWLLPTELILKLGGFSPAFFHYGEDYNYILRMRYHGFPLRLVSKSIVYHDRDIESRMKSEHQTQIRKTERKLLDVISDPANEDNALDIKLKLIRKCLSRIRRFEPIWNSTELIQLKAMRNYDFTQLIAYRELSKKLNSPFLD